MHTATIPRLNTDRRKLAERFLAAEPKPGNLLRLFRPAMYRRALALGFTHEDIDSLCMVAVVKKAATFKHDPTRATFKSAVKWTMYQVVTAAVRRESYRRTRIADLAAGADDGCDPIQNLPDPVQFTERLALRDLGERTREQVNRVLAERVERYRDREIFALRFGLRDGEPRELEAIASLFNLSPPAVAAVVVAVIIACRDELESLYLLLTD